MKKITYIIFAIFFATQTLKSQANSDIFAEFTSPLETITFEQFLHTVGQNNLGFIAETFEVSIAEAEAQSIKVKNNRTSTSLSVRETIFRKTEVRNDRLQSRPQ